MYVKSHLISEPSNILLVIIYEFEQVFITTSIGHLPPKGKENMETHALHHFEQLTMSTLLASSFMSMYIQLFGLP